MRSAILLLLLALAACAGGGTSGPYVGGAVGGSVREDTRLR
ncbi:hypothetical protein [Paracraurococcus lichenis]|uniref:Lipoprotein n=1 Tax=Paracraurococcus lichenis TaxID=3064888 RepID=A0ABT9E0D0_9PROT|nr:hypothetical protein [Paracraurococcus sp. LOR1-02]MDO9709627.1 hypothetical protein [Paracraurococcus sp. LOR1-02]